MARVLLHLLLILTLLSNGVSAPWAMERMGHGDRAGNGMHALHGPADAAAGHASAHHGGAADVGVPVLPDRPIDCCDGATCQCGCVLPPAMPLAFGVAVAPLPSAAPTVPLPQLDVALHTSPPFRPPAA